MTRLIPGKTKVEVELFRGVTLGDVLVGGVTAAMLMLVVLSNLPYKFGICIVVCSVAGLLLFRIDEQANYRYLLHVLGHFGYDRHLAKTYTDKMLVERGEGRMDEAAFNELFRNGETRKETKSEKKERLKAENAAKKGRAKERKREDKLLKSKKTSEEEKQAILKKRAEEDEEERRAAEKKGAPAEEDKRSKKARKAAENAKAKERKAAEKAREAERRREDKILRSKKASEEEKKAIRQKREEEAEREYQEALQRAAEDGKADSMTPKERKANEKVRARIRKEEDKKLKSKTVPEEEKEAIRERRNRESEEAMRKMADAKDAATTRKSMDGIVGFTSIHDGLIEYGNKEYYGAAIEIDPVEFRFFSEHRRQNSIEAGVGRILRAINAKYSANIVKLERPIRYESYLEKEYEKLFQLRSSYESGLLTEDELKARVEIEYDRINELRFLCDQGKVVTGFYYIVLFESDRRQLELQINNALTNLTQGEMRVHRLNNKELAVFLKYSNALDFDEHEIDKINPEDYAQWAKPETVDIKARRVEVNHIVTHNFRVVNYPSLVGDAWLAGVMSIPGTKVVVKCKPMDRVKAIRGIDHSLIELRGQWSATGVDSKRLEIEEHLSTLQELLGTLQADNESLLECNVYITAYDIVGTRRNFKIKQPGDSILPTIADMKKTIRRTWQESSFRLNNMEFEQVQAFIGSQVSGLDPLSRQGRGIPSNTVAACYPWIFAHISDEGGVKLGANDGIPVFINFFRRDSERVNSNMVIVGKSGSGKSYATKSILSNLAADDSKIFILDPENEYQELAGNLHGKIINVGNAQYGRLNPFHIITALDDDEAGDSGPSGSYATHLQFLEEFFRQIMPDCDKDSMEYLNTLLDRLYSDFNISAETDLSKLKPEDYPVFDDLYDTILQEYQSTDNEYIRTLLRTLMNYIAKFSTGGRNANIWNGPSTVTTESNFTVFNFQSMLANRNQIIANAQMLLVLKYVDNEIIKNRDYNMKYGLKRKVVVVIDEAHVFIDAKYPIALDFMFQLAKRIRKYNGMQIVITQNIKDFVGSEEIARKSTAIINACQYSFIFALAPNDIQDLVKLYENAGGINENEQEQIVQAPRGQAFTIMSPTSRSTFRVETGSSMIHMFEDKKFVSQYFVGEQGADNWEDFVADSRIHHDEAVMSRWETETEDEKDDAVSHQAFKFEEVDEADYEEKPQKKSGGFMFEEEIDDTPRTEAETQSGNLAHNLAIDTAEERESTEQDTAMAAMMGMFSTMASKMTEAFERIGVPVASPSESGASVGTLSRPAAVAVSDPALTAQLAAKDAEIERLRQEMEQLKLSMAQGAARPMEETAPAAPALTEQEFSGKPSSEINWSMDEEPEEEIDWSTEKEPGDEIDWSTEEEPGDEIDWSTEGEPGDEIDWSTEEEPAAETEIGETPDGSPAAKDDVGADVFDLRAFLSLSVQHAQSLTFVERMRRNGKETSEITLSELAEYLEKKKQQAREIA